MEYLKYYTGISSVKLISSLSGFYTEGYSYNPTMKEILIFKKSKYTWVAEKEMSADWKEEHNIANVEDIYSKWTLEDLASHPAIIYFPYSVMSYKLTEFYSMFIPLFIPSPKYLLQHEGMGSDRTSTSPPYCRKRMHLNSKVLKHPTSPHPYSPNEDFVDNPEAEIAFKLLQEAYDVLSDRTKRRQYDRLRSFTNGNPQNFSRQNERASQQSQRAANRRVRRPTSGNRKICSPPSRAPTACNAHTRAPAKARCATG